MSTGTYTIKSGDTLGKIAAEQLGSASRYQELADFNNIADANKISVGQVINIPGKQPETKTAVEETVASNNSDDNDFSLDQLKKILNKAPAKTLETYLEGLNQTLKKYEINTPIRRAHFIAQVAHESGEFKYTAENLNYSASALQAVFGKYFPSADEAESYARQPERIANKVYANRMGNGDEASGDGWKYRGRGFIQLTGNDNYSAYNNDVDEKDDVIGNPELIENNPAMIVGTAGWYWNSRNINKAADADDVLKVTKLINGSTNGLEDRTKYLNKAKEVLNLA
ncbi:MAG: LysM peptidoglycan-binding domain-containing protein [Pseudomonadales bacterium]|nr:LysM peptidoglycan-binding domain-containing protein [Pseudomonadales bacterium]